VVRESLDCRNTEKDAAKNRISQPGEGLVEGDYPARFSIIGGVGGLQNLGRQGWIHFDDFCQVPGRTVVVEGAPHSF